MRLIELKCKNCGASVKVEENATQAKCEFCKTTFAVEDAYNAGYKFEKGRMKAQNEQLEKKLDHAKGILQPIGKVFAAQYIFVVIVSIIIFVTAIIMIGVFATRQTKSISEFDAKRFNGVYELYNGSSFGMEVESLIDEVITNNKKNKNHQLTIKYKDISTQESEKMKEIKKEIGMWTKYEVTFEYDENGLIYLVTIEE